MYYINEYIGTHSDLMDYLLDWKFAYCISLSFLFFTIRTANRHFVYPISIVIFARFCFICWLIYITFWITYNLLISIVHQGHFVIKNDHFFLTVLAYEFTIRSYLDIIPDVGSQPPKYHQGALDGDFIWAAVLTLNENESSKIDLTGFIALKYLQMDAIVWHLICLTIIDAESLEILSFQFPKIVHYIRRAHLIFQILNLNAPWLLWIPDALVYIVAVGLYIASITDQPENRMNSPSELVAGVQAMLNSPQFSATSPSPMLHATSINDLQSLETLNLEGSDGEDETLNTEAELAYEEFKKEIFKNNELQMDGLFEDLADIDDDFQSNSDYDTDTTFESLSSTELNDLVNDCFNNSTDPTDETYVCPDRILTRRMRQKLLNTNKQLHFFPLARKSSQLVDEAAKALGTIAESVTTFQETLRSQAPVTRMVDRILQQRKERNQRNNIRNILCVICTNHRRDIILTPCQHLCICQQCKIEMGQKGLGRCPVCRVYVKDSIRIYWS